MHVARNASLGGDGMITGSVTNSGTIAPGASAGVLTINGTLTLEDVGNLHLEIGGTSQAVDFDFISVSNTVHFAGRLQISLINEFTPTGTDTFPILRFVSATGTFANAPNGGRVKTANRLGSFRVNYEAQTVTLTDYQSTDVDADGIEDAWALQHFGHSPLSAAERQADADSDGLSNYGEFVAGTDPTLAASVFKVLSVKTANNGAVILQFSGNDETTYRIWRSEDLITWMEASAQNFVTRAAGLHEWTGNTVSLSGPGFYRVSVE